MPGVITEADIWQRLGGDEDKQQDKDEENAVDRLRVDVEPEKLPTGLFSSRWLHIRHSSFGFRHSLPPCISPRSHPSLWKWSSLRAGRWLSRDR
jgi:hypothetical protein